MDSRVPYSKSQCPAADSDEAIRMKTLPFRELTDEFLTSIEFQQTDADPCIYKRTEMSPDNKEHFSMVALYVDDLIIACSHPKEYQRLEAEFQRRYSMKILRSLKHILGMDVHYDLHNHAIHLSQSMYIK